jgi:creatinine amidohydrolase
MAVLNEAGEKLYLVDYTWDELAALPRREALKIVLPIGSTEEHGYHLPLGTDTWIACRIVELAARKVPGVIVLPPMSYGCCLDTMNFCGTLSVSSNTLRSLIADVVENLYRHGFRKLLVYNGHGGNKGVADTALREALLNLNRPGEPFLDRIAVYLANAFEKQGGELRKMMDGKDYGHACEMETSVMLALYPDSVKMERAVEQYMPGDPDTIWRIRDMQVAASSGIHGAADRGTVEKGRKILEMLVADLVSLLERI